MNMMVVHRAHVFWCNNLPLWIEHIPFQKGGWEFNQSQDSSHDKQCTLRCDCPLSNFPFFFFWSKGPHRRCSNNECNPIGFIRLKKGKYKYFPWKAVLIPNYTYLGFFMILIIRQDIYFNMPPKAVVIIECDSNPLVKLK